MIEDRLFEEDLNFSSRDERTNLGYDKRSEEEGYRRQKKK